MGASTVRLGDFLDVHREEILREWEAMVRTHPEARPLSGRTLRDHIPPLLEHIAAAVRATGEQTQGQHLARLPEIHAIERLDIGFDLETVVSELGMLRQVVFRQYGPFAAGRNGCELLDELRRFDDAITEVTEKSVLTYARARERTLVALDRISAAALGTGELGAFLPRLLQVLMETTAAADFVAVFLREGDLLRLRAAVGPKAERVMGQTIPIGQRCAGIVAQTREPLLVHSAATDPHVTDEYLRSVGARALYGVPLMHEDEVIGVAKMASCTAYDFSGDDKQLFRAMARRATSLIVQAQLLSDLRASEERFRLMVNGVTDHAILMLDPEGRITSWNRGAERINGYTEAEALGRSYAFLFPEELREKDEPRRLLEEAAERGVSQHVAVRVRKDGTRYHADATLTAVRDSEGVLRGFAKITRDVTERTEAEHERERLAVALEARSSLLDEVITRLPVGVVIVEPSGRFVKFNEKLARVWGLEGLPEVASLEEYHLSRGRFADGREVGAEEWPMARAIRERKPTPEVQIELDRADGSTAVTLQSAAPVFDDAGNVIAAVVTIIDITERAEAEVLRERFTAILGHDLKNPLQTITLSTSAMLRSETFPDAWRRHVGRIASSARTMSQMISDLLDATRGRIGSGMPVQPEPMDLRAVVQQVAEELEIEFPERHIEVDAVCRSADCPDFRGEWDLTRLQQLVQNLARNAVRHGAADGPVRLSLEDGGTEVRLSVHNRGEPIPDDLRPDLFKPFRRRSDSTEGLGLGLYIVQEIARGHGGRVTFTSSREEGTTFVVTLPRGRNIVRP